MMQQSEPLFSAIMPKGIIRALVFLLVGQHAIGLRGEAKIIDMYGFERPGSNADGFTVGMDPERSFIENKGQFRFEGEVSSDPEIKYAYSAGLMSVYFASNRVMFSLTKPVFERADLTNKESDHDPEFQSIKKQTEYISMIWEGANDSALISGLEMTPDYHIYAMEDGSGNYSSILSHAFKRLICRNIYPNIDVVYSFDFSGDVKYALILHPGADISDIRMKYSKQITLKDGSISIPTKYYGEIWEHPPLTFYTENETSVIGSEFSLLNDSTASFNLGPFDHTRSITIDPSWSTTITSQSAVWEVEADASGNIYVMYAQIIAPVKVRKLNNAGTTQWTWTAPATWQSNTTVWMGSMETSSGGDTYVTWGAPGRLAKISAAGTQLFIVNDASSREYWSPSLNCDESRLAIGGNIAGNLYDINMSTGAIVSTRTVASGANEIRSLCSAPNGYYYYLCHTTVGAINDGTNSCLGFSTSNTYNFPYKCEYYRPFSSTDNGGICAIKANGNFFYTHRGNQVDKRDITTGAIITSAAIPSGVLTGGRVRNSGIDIDASGNVYVGSYGRVIKYDPNLTILSNTALSTTEVIYVYDVAVNINGDIVVAGSEGDYSTGASGPGGANDAFHTGYIQQLNMGAGAQMPLTCTSPCLVLPIELVNFSSKCDSKNVEFSWKTESEVNNDYFTLEGSLDGIIFSEVEKIQGSGSSNMPRTYSISIERQKAFHNYFRLKQTDYNGYFTHSEIINLDCHFNEGEFSAYPNPASKNLDIIIKHGTDAKITITVTDLLGRTSLKREVDLSEGVNKINLDISDLKPAVYMLNIYDTVDKNLYKSLKIIKCL